MSRFIGVLLGSFLPPVGVFMVKGPAFAFWLNILLTLLFWVPGQVHALWVIAHTRSDGRPAANGMSTFIALLLAWLLPPLGVALKEGVSVTLLINIVLTLLFWIPGSIHALWVICED